MSPCQVPGVEYRSNGRRRLVDGDAIVEEQVNDGEEEV